MLADGIKCTQESERSPQTTANVPSPVVDGTRTECRFIFIACLPTASVMPIDSAADRRNGDFGRSPFCGQLSGALNLPFFHWALFLAK
jgi:hypothetical protein